MLDEYLRKGNEKMIYLDNAATTAVAERVYTSMKPYLKEWYGNPASIYSFAGKAKEGVDKARDVVAKFIGANSNEVYFTSGGSESDNWAIKGAAFALESKGKHIITTKIEHHAVLHTCQFLEKRGFEVTYLDVDENGLVTWEQVEQAIRPDTILISVMYANNEIGTIEPIAEIGAVARKHGILFHTDAVQAYGHDPIDVEKANIDLLSASGHKIHGPKGIGILYMRNGVSISPLIHGGAQERSKRGGTHNVPGIVGFGEATRLAKEHMLENRTKETQLRDYLIQQLLKEIPYAKLNGHPVRRLSNNINICFRFIEGESMLILLDQQGIYGSSGSACTSGSLDPSHVLLAIGLPHEIAHGSLRLTLSPENTKEELDYVVKMVTQNVERLRNMSPLYEDFIKKQN